MIAVILAGGLGKRMMSEIPKVLHIIDGRPMLVHVVCQARMLGPEKIYIVVGKYQQLIATALERYGCLKDVSFIQQETPKVTRRHRIENLSLVEKGRYCAAGQCHFNLMRIVF